jgi:outer membrane protein
LKRLSLLIIAMALSHGLPAANLSDIYKEALARDARFASARAAYRAAQERVPQGRAGLLPTVNLDANWRYTDAQQESELGSFDQEQDSYGYSLALVQPLFRKQNFEQYDLSKLQVRQAEYQLASAQQDLILRVAQAYFDVLLAEVNIELARAQKAAIAEQLAQAKRSFEVGTATITDTHEAQARFDLTRAQEIAAENELEVRKRALEAIIGTPAPSLATPKEEAIPVRLPEPNQMEAWVTQAEEANLQLLIARSGLEIARRNVELQRAGHYPTLDLAASYTDNRNLTSPSLATGIDSQAAVIGLEFGWTLYQGGLISSQVREAVANEERAREDALEALRQADFTARQAFLGVTSGEAQIRALRQAVISSQAQLESTQLGLEVGVRTGVDLLNARQQLYSARRDLAAAHYNYIISAFNLKAAAGTLNETDVAAVDSLLSEAR